MKIVTQATETEEIIKKSRFIAALHPCSSETEAKQIIYHYYQQFPDASHVVFAYRIQTDKGLVCRFNDAGEPSGTAGKPIYQHLEGKQIINAVLIVVRYFGGIKLGAGGLTRAYSGAAKKVIEASTLSDYIDYAQIKLELDYKDFQQLEYHLKKLDGKIIHQDFGAKVNVTLKLPSENIESLKSLIFIQPK